MRQHPEKHIARSSCVCLVPRWEPLVEKFVLAGLFFRAGRDVDSYGEGSEYDGSDSGHGYSDDDCDSGASAYFSDASDY